MEKVYYVRVVKPVFQDWSQSWKQVLDGWGHLGHTDDVDDSLESPQDATKYFRILFTQILIQNYPKMTKQFFL